MVKVGLKRPGNNFEKLIRKENCSNDQAWLNCDRESLCRFLLIMAVS